MNIEISHNYISVPLIELLDYVIGGDWGKEPELKDDDYSLAYCIRGSEFKNWNTEKGKTASLRKIKKGSLENRKLQEGDILIEISGGGPDQPVGRTVVIDKSVLSFQPEVPKVCTNFLRLARPSVHLDYRYVNYYLLFFYKYGGISDYQGGSNNLRNLKFDDYSSIEIPIAPYNEQKRIVEKIEELFSDLEKGVEYLENTKKKMKVYRQAVLKWAFEGKITNDNSIAIVPLSQTVEQPKYGTSKKCDYKIKGKGVLRIPNISNGFIDSQDLKFASFEKDEIETYSLKEGDLLTIRSNGSVDLVGKCALITKKDEKFLYAGYLIRLRPNKEKVIPKFLFLVLSSHDLRIQIESKAKSSSGVNNINSEELKSLMIPLPSIKQQKIILQEIESRLSVCDKIEEMIEESLQQADALHYSILKKAFEGRLVPQDPNDEPASILLQRINAEKEKNKLVMNGKKAKSRTKLKEKA
ncbi:MAG: restriction endonuclease subunit S [Chitinophagales bacterium]|nr:restriction endonuclease subunit S [Chitinophagales bacterium]